MVAMEKTSVVTKSGNALLINHVAAGLICLSTFEDGEEF
jgi:hypothetical protein